MTSQEAKKGPKKSSSPFDLFRFLTGDEKVFIRPHHSEANRDTI